MRKIFRWLMGMLGAQIAMGARGSSPLAARLPGAKLAEMLWWQMRAGSPGFPAGKPDTGGARSQSAAAWLAQLGRFLLVGAIGFAVDICATILLAPVAGIGPGRIAAIVMAVVATYWLNRQVTFGSGSSRVLHEAARYGLVSLAGASINFATYWASLAALAGFGVPQPSGAALTAAVAAGSAMAIACNFLGAKFFAFAK